MESRWFDGYGELEYLEPADYYAEPWTYVCSDWTYDENGNLEEGNWDLVRHNQTMEMRYTSI